MIVYLALFLLFLAFLFAWCKEKYANSGWNKFLKEYNQLANSSIQPQAGESIGIVLNPKQNPLFRPNPPNISTI